MILGLVLALAVSLAVNVLFVRWWRTVRHLTRWIRDHQPDVARLAAISGWTDPGDARRAAHMEAFR